MYASSRARIPLDTRSISRRLNQRVTLRQLETLSHAGFIRLSASKPASTPLATRARTREAEAETDRKSKKSSAPTWRQRVYTGCRITHGSHGAGYVYDALGTDRPPPDWPYEPPTQAEVQMALNGQVSL